jgi:hypothetical protein
MKPALTETRRQTMDTTYAPTLTAPTVSLSRARLWTGRVITGFVGLFLLFDCAIKLLKLGPAVTGTVELGYPAGVVFPLGLVLAACLALYLIPRTAIFGAVLLTGYLGGAIATHVRVGHPLFSHTLFPIYVAVLVWGALYLRDGRVRALIAPRARG